MAEGRTPEFWILMFHYFCYFCLKLKVLGWYNSSDLSGQKESLFFPSATGLFAVKGQLASATTKPFILICGIIKILELSECKTIFLA